MESIRGKKVQEWTDEQLDTHFARLVDEAEAHEDSVEVGQFPKLGIMFAIKGEKLQRLFDRNPAKYSRGTGVVPEWMANFGVTAK